MSFLTAVRLLTSIPLPQAGRDDAAARSRSIVWFPLIGAGLGALVWGADWALRLALDARVAAALSIALLALLTGFLHLDGLSDTADATFAHRTRQQRLAIMRDSHAGAFGITAVVILLLTKWAALSELDDPARLLALVAGGAASRWGAVVAMRAFPLARGDGQARAYAGSITVPAVIATLIAVGLATASFQAAGAVMLALTAMVALALGLFYTRLLGGLTGDVYGAIVETGEAAVWVAAPTLAGWILVGA
jgi:cobalamin 5'-phosphate synthase/cobalamin synthase